MDYKNLGLDKYLNKSSSLASKTRRWTSEFDQDVTMEKPVFLGPVVVAKGTVVITSGGVLECKDATGGTTILTYDPTSGTITLAGDVTVTSITSGTISNSKFITGTVSGGLVGTSQITGGTLGTATVAGGLVGTTQMTGGTAGTVHVSGGTLGTATVLGGTVNPSAYQIKGTAGLDGTIAFDDLGTITHTVEINQGLITAWGTA